MNSNAWKNVLSIPEGKVYWRVVGTRMNGAIAKSKVHSFTVESRRAVENPKIVDVNKKSLPSLSWENNCNIKFKVWFGSDPGLTRHYTLTSNIKNPTEGGGEFSKTLTPSQWKAVRKLVGDVSGSTIYWYVESWDGLNRHTETDVMRFVLID